MTSLPPPIVIPRPQIGVVSSYVKRSVRLEILNSTERIPREYGRQEFRPEVVALAWTCQDDSPDWTLIRAEVMGSVWKTDGTAGRVPACREYTGGGRRISDAPDWLIDLVLRHGPFGTVGARK